ncbi:hypothetical protein BH20ACI2_BH20ACI2_22810 [soil metagenome]
MSLDLTLKNREFNFNVTNSSEHKVYEFEDFRLDVTTRLLYRSGEQVALTPKAVETLIALVERQGTVVAKDELMQEIWADTIVEESNLAQYLHVLRKTLGETSDGKPYIETLKRRGYRFNGTVRLSKEGNGLPAPNSDRGKFEAGSPNGPLGVANSPSRRVERHGNVLAVADWVEIEEMAEVVDLQETPPVADRITFQFLALASVAVAILFAFFSFGWFRSPAAGADQPSPVNSELSITPLTNAEIVYQATISPDGKYFAYVELGNDSARLWLQQVGESSRIETVDLSGRIVGITFTPDSSAVYYLASRKGDTMNSLYRVGSLGGVPTRILTDLSSPVSFSPDGNEIAFVRVHPDNGLTHLLVAASDGSRERVLLSRAATEKFQPNPAWSPDGKQIAIGLYSYEKSIGVCSMVGIDLSGDTIKPLSNEKWDSCDRTAWLGDGSGLVFIGTKFKEAVTTRRDQVYHLSMTSGDARRLTNSGNRHEVWSLGVTNANEILALPFNRVSQIWSLETGADSQTAKRITTGQSDGRGGIESLPDGSIFYLARMGDGFGIFRTNVGDVRDSKAIAADPTMEELRASPDGRFLVFAAKVVDGYAHLFRVDPDGSNRQQLTFGESVQSDSTVSPDGRWIVYASHFLDGDRARYSLQKIPSEGGDPVLLLNESCRTPHFSPDGRMISCIDKELIRVVSFENGETLKTFKTAGTPILNSGSRWTPDGQNLAYRVHEKDVVNLWLQPVDGGVPRQLTNFTHGDIYNFTFSPEGSRIYLAHGNPIRNAVLIKNFN